MEPGPPLLSLPLLPRYGAASLAELVSSILACLDVPGFDNRLGLDPAERVCLLLIDGLWGAAALRPTATGGDHHGGPRGSGRR
jgi:hypothetical protein